MVRPSWRRPPATALPGLRLRGASGVNMNSGRAKTANQIAVSGPVARAGPPVAGSRPKGGERPINVVSFPGEGARNNNTIASTTTPPA